MLFYINTILSELLYSLYVYVAHFLDYLLQSSAVELKF